MIEFIKEILLCFTVAELYLSVNGVPDTRCIDSQGNKVNSGERFFPGPGRLRPCIECLCVRGNAALCGIAMCVGQVDCTIPKWRTTMCCQPECINQKRLLLSDIRTSSMNDNSTGGSRDTHAPYQTGGYFDTGSVFGVDESNNYLPPLNYDTFSVDQTLQDGNATITGTTRQQNLPSPYYPILIGLISCAPVALCIISINALRKYFALRGQCNHGRSFFPSRGRLRRGRNTEDPNLSLNRPGMSSPTAYLDPPPSYKDLDSLKLKFQDDLPKYEDVLKHDQQNQGKIFATMSSAVHFSPPERINFYCFPSTSADTEASTSVVQIHQPESSVAVVNETTVSSTSTTTSDSEATSQTLQDEGLPRTVTRNPPTLSESEEKGIDNPALEP